MNVARHDPPDASTAPWALGPGRPRRHHCEFAHRALPLWLHGDAIAMAGGLSGPGRRAWLRRLWDHVGEALAPEDRLGPDGLDYELRVVRPGLAVLLFTLPRPRARSEAYFVAAVLCGWPGTLPREEVLVRVFALEQGPGPRTNGHPGQGVAAGGQPAAAVVCEWTPAGEHSVTGGQVAPNRDAFVAEILTMIGVNRRPGVLATGGGDDGQQRRPTGT
jgi:hypothetical protein